MKRTTWPVLLLTLATAACEGDGGSSRPGSAPRPTFSAATTKAREATAGPRASTVVSTASHQQPHPSRSAGRARGPRADATARSAVEKPRQPPRIYATWQSFPLHRHHHGIDGTVRLLQDGRLTRKGATRSGLVDIDDALVPAAQRVFLPARLELVSTAGNVLGEATFERAVADMRPELLYGDTRPTYFVTVDLSAGMGSYAGPITYLFEVQNGKLQRLKAADMKSGQSEPIALMDSLKTAWRIVPSKHQRGKDILHAACRPVGDHEPAIFVTGFARFSFEDGHWVKRWVQQKKLIEVGCDWDGWSRFPI